jgi:hypothetical protein
VRTASDNLERTIDFYCRSHDINVYWLTPDAELRF